MAYRVEYARSGQSACKGPKPCKGSKIGKATMRFGTVIDIAGTTSLAWRHWGCVTERIVKNLQDKIGEAEDLDGYEDLTPDDQARVEYAFQNGHIPPDDITPTLKQEADDTAGENDESPKKTKKKKKSKASANEDTSPPHSPSPPKKVTARRSKKKKVEDDGAAEDGDAYDDAETEAKPIVKQTSRKRQKPGGSKAEDESMNAADVKPVSTKRKHALKAEEGEAGPMLEQSKQPKKKGRPSTVKEENLERSVSNDADRPQKVKQQVETDQTNADQTDKPPKVKRGRTAGKKVETEIENFDDVEKPQKAVRGRPKKSVDAQQMAAKQAQADQPSSEEAGPSDSKDGVKKARGRPRKSMEQPSSELEASSDVKDVAKQGRGRPNKVKEQSAPSDDIVIAAPTAGKRGRGRPKKEQ